MSISFRFKINNLGSSLEIDCYIVVTWKGIEQALPVAQMSS